MADDVLISTRVLGLCLRNWNYPLADHTHVCQGLVGQVGHPTRHRCRCRCGVERAAEVTKDGTS